MENNKRTRDEMIEDEEVPGIMCYERWSHEKLDQIRRLCLPQELKDRLDSIRLENGVERVKVRYSTCQGDKEGRVYGSIVYYSQFYRKKLAKEGKTFSYMDEHAFKDEQDAGPSLQRMDRWIRRLLAHEYYHDYDIANCAPILLQQIIEKAGLAPPAELIAYNTDRTAIFARYNGRIDLGLVKKTFLKVLHMGGSHRDIPESISLKTALRATLLKLSNLNEKYRAIYAKCKDDCERDSKKKKFRYLAEGGEYVKVTKSLGKFCAVVWQREESRVLMSMREYFIGHGYPAEHMVLCFDGIMIERRESDATDNLNLESVSSHVFEKTGYRVKIEEKSLQPTENDMAIYEGRAFFEKKPPK